MKLALGWTLLVALAWGVDVRNESNDARRARLTEECSHDKRWRVQELDDYFLVTDVADRSVVGELADRAEKTRARVRGMLRPFPGCCPAPEPDNPNLPPSKTVLRLHAKVGRNVGSLAAAGSYSRARTEIALLNGSQPSGRAEMFRAAQRAVVREVLDAELGPAPQAAWFQCGLEDYFAAFALRNGRLEHRTDAANVALVGDLLSTGQTVSLAALVQMPSSDFDAPAIRAQAWSLMSFLLDRNCRGVARSEIVARHVAKWKETHDPAVATAFAFEGVDWPTFEREWRAFADEIR